MYIDRMVIGFILGILSTIAILIFIGLIYSKK